MISCTDFIIAYSELFKYLHARGGKSAVVDFWNCISDRFLGNLRGAVVQNGIRGCWLYWNHTLNEEAADFTMELDEEAGEFRIAMHRCPSMMKLNETKHVEPYAHYCEHCDVLYRRVLEPLGFSYSIDLSDCKQARCEITVRDARVATLAPSNSSNGSRNRSDKMKQLAINGGPRAVTNKLAGWPQFDENSIRAVEQVLRSGKVNYWTGRKGMEFEEKFAAWQGSKYAVAVSNGTAALHVALSALGIGPGDEVIVPSYTFIATSFSVVQAGAIPRFADVNRDDHCISLESAEKLVTKRTKAIIPVHLYGNVCDMEEVLDFARRHNLFVIEDNAEAFGGVYKGRKTGTWGHMAACSFCQNKTFTTGGEGGMVTTDDEDLAWKARSVRDHGYDVQARLNLLELEQKLPYIHNIVGWNYRMTEMQSAIGLAELERLDSWNMPRRRRNARILIDALKDRPEVLYCPIDTPDRQNGWYVMAFSLDIENMGCDIAEFVMTAGAEGVPCWKVFWPQCHTENAFRLRQAFGRSGFPFTSKEYADSESVDYNRVEVPNALWHEKHTFTCFGFPTFSEEDMQQIAGALLKVIDAYSKQPETASARQAQVRT